MEKDTSKAPEPSPTSTVMALSAPKVSLIDLVQRNRVSLSILLLLIIGTVLWGMWTFGGGVSDNELITLLTTGPFAVAVVAILVWFGLFVPLYVNPYRLQLITSTHPGSRAWANYVTKELRAYAEGTVSLTPKIGSKGYISVSENDLLIWRLEADELTAYLRIPRETILGARSVNVAYTPDAQPEVEVTVSGVGAPKSFLLMPGPRGFERRGKTARSVSLSLGGPRG